MTEGTDKQLPDISRILELLPHRYPMLLVDRVKSCDGTTLVAIKNVTINEAFFAGHFPQKPIMPGVFILEALGQACGLLMSEQEELQSLKGFLFFVVGIDKAKFRSIVEPGDQLELEVTMTRSKGIYFAFDTVAKVNGKVVTEAVVNLMVNKNN